MNPEQHESQAWGGLRARGASRLSPGFADRVLREARARTLAEPSISRQFALGAVTAALCFLAVAIFDARTSGAAAASSQADWQQIASTSDEVAQLQ